MNSITSPPDERTENKKPRLTDMERLQIAVSLNEGMTVYAIAKQIGRPPKTVMREIRRHAVDSDKGAVGRVSNRCTHRYECDKHHVCPACYQRHKNIACKFCNRCNANCPDFQEDNCQKLQSPPYVCNGCKHLSRCTLKKRFYDNVEAGKQYVTCLHESRKGANISEDELQLFDALLYGLLQNGQSVHAAIVNNPGMFSVSEKTVYRYIKGGLLQAKNGDLPRACSLKPRSRKSVEHKVDAQCRIGRSWDCYCAFTAEHPGLPLTEIDTVESVKGGKVLLTLMFMPYGFMLAFLLDGKKSAFVCDAFQMIYDKLIGKYGKDVGLAIMSELFFITITDNGTEFTQPRLIEYDRDGNKIGHVFYANPYASYQKAHCERNHEFIRNILPKGTTYFLPTSFNDLTQDDVDKMMSHINSYVREGLKDRTPYDLMAQKYGTEFCDLFHIRKIPANEVILKPSLLGIEQKVRPEITRETEPRK